MPVLCRRLRFAPLAVLAACCLAPTPSEAGVLIPEDLARRNGMQRAWFSQVQLNPARNEVANVVLDGDTLVAVTSAGVVHTMNANTGATLWTTRIGNPSYPSLGPSMSEKHIALVNGSTVYVLNRATGGEVLRRKLGGGAGGGPSLSSGHVFVPLFSGRIEGFHLDAPKRIPWYYTSAGRIFQPSVADGASVVWSTDRSKLYVASGDAGGVRYRFDTGSPIVAPAAVRSPYIYAGSLAGYVFALNESTGQQRWRYAAGFSVRSAPVVVGDSVYVATDEPALHALDAETGQLKWISAGISGFIAASRDRVYAFDTIGGLVVLDIGSGVPQARAASRGINTAVLNNQTDRLYIFSRDGLIQCLHEIGADEPYYHRAGSEADKKKRKPTKRDKADEKDPLRDPFADPVEDPFSDGADDPFADPPMGGDDPFADPPAGGGDDPFADPPAGGDDPFGEPADEGDAMGEPAGDDPFGDAGDDPFADDDPFGS
ncbi:MAG: PQQ-binding-like beta-propeller repeat protein [Planctomycetota bacterium]